MNFIIDNFALIMVSLTSGGLLLWPKLKQAQSGVTATEAVQIINRKKTVVIDVNDAETFAQGHAPQAKNAPLAQFETQLAQLAKDKEQAVVLLCTTGAKASKAAAAAKKLGYSSAVAVKGGLDAWRTANLPVQKS